MRVVVTGANGFVGAHTIKALVAAGHDVAALVRSEAKLERALSLVRCQPIRALRGDITDRASVRSAVKDADAVFHAAAVYSLVPSQASEMGRTNAAGAKNVLEEAADAGAKRIVHVSSVVALYPMTQFVRVTGPDGPPIGSATGAYFESKQQSERIARDLQARGAPLVISYPGAVLGPYDPGPGEMVHVLRGFLRNFYCFRLWGAGFSWVDVRWLARAHVAMLEHAAPPPRVLTAGHFLSWNDVFGVFRGLTGRWLPMIIPAPKAISLATGRLSDGLSRLLQVRMPLSYEAVASQYHSRPCDAGPAEGLAGPMPPIEETVRDAIAWCVEAGHLTRAQAGRVLTSASATAQ